MNDTTLPPLGAAIREKWHLDPAALTVNHGSFGATPKSVLAAQDEWRQRMEAQPTRFMALTLPEALRAAAGRLASFLGARAEDVAFTDNATTGCNAILRSLRLAPGDEILMLDHGYGAVKNTARHVAALAGARMVEAALPFPRPDGDAIVAAMSVALTPRTRLVVIDHITSPSALVLPIAPIIAACHAAGARVLIDGAHGPGQVDLDLDALGADWYAGNCHKWLMAPKGCAFLWARADRQDDLHPVAISHGYGKGYLAEFDWTGTRDPSAFLAVGAAIDFYEGLGGARLARRNTALAAEAGNLLARRFGTECGSTGDTRGAMALVRLPILGPVDQARALVLRQRLLRDHATDAPLNAIGGAVWLRLSAQAYNEIGDYERLGDIVERLVRDNR